MNKIIGRLYHRQGADPGLPNGVYDLIKVPYPGIPLAETEKTVSVDSMLLNAIKADHGERLNDCINNLLRSAAKGEEWATKLLFERLDNGAAKK